MQRTSQQDLLKAIFKKAYNRPYNGSSDDKIMMQSAIFFMHEKGVYCGDYQFAWENNMPYCPALEDELNKEIFL